MGQVIAQTTHAVALILHHGVLSLSLLQGRRTAALAGRYPILARGHRPELGLILRPQLLKRLLHAATYFRDIGIGVTSGVVGLQRRNEDRRIRTAQVLLLPLGPEALGAKNNLRDNRHTCSVGNARSTIAHRSDFETARDGALCKDANKLATLGQLGALHNRRPTINAIHRNVPHHFEEAAHHRSLEHRGLGQVTH